MRIKKLCPVMVILAVLVLSMPAFAGRKFIVSKGQTVYVPVYSHIYQGKKGSPYNLSALLSLRNVDYTHSITITSVRYYGSDGQFIKEHFKNPVVIPPMGTKEVHIKEQDTEGGSGANFTVKWVGGTEVSVPVIQAVMIGTASTQGISFVCDGVVIEED
jgi:hypothetical protein